MRTAQDRIDESLDRIESLSPAPQILPQLLDALNEPDNDLGRVVELIAVDPAFTAKLLETCNSAFFGGSTPVSDVRGAVNRLGFKAVYQVIAAVSAAQFLRPAQPSGLDVGELWTHSVTVAIAAQFLAEDIGIESGLLYTAGLLHDMGKVVLDEAYGADYAGLLAEGAPFGRRLAELEKARFGVDHAEAGGRLLERWKFSTPLVASLRFHHNPSAAGDAARLAAVVDLADILAHSLKSDPPERTFSNLHPDDALKNLGFSLDKAASCRDRIMENMRFVETMCRIHG